MQQQHPASSLQQRLLAAGGAFGGRSEWPLLAQLHDQQDIAASLQARVDELQTHSKQMEQAAGQPRPSASASASS
jgi:hypothetical protein